MDPPATASPTGASTPQDVAYFPQYSESPRFTSEIANKLVSYGFRRVQKSGIGSIVVDMEQPSAISHSELELGECLGQGSFSNVFDVVSLKKSSSQTNNNNDNDDESNSYPFKADQIVVKLLRRRLMENPKMFAACAGDLFKEALILSTLNHKNIVSSRAMAWDGITAYLSGRHDAFFIVMDKLDDTLSDRIKRWKNDKKKLRLSFSSSFTDKNKLEERAALLQSKSNVILQLADAIEYIHSSGLIHRDIKPDNIGFDADGVLKVFDFDVARALPEELGKGNNNNDHLDTFKMTRRVGSPRYMSPECALGEEYNAKVDVYSFGLVCHEIITLKKPFADLASERHDKQVFVEGERPTIPKSWTRGLSDIVQLCWTPKVGARPTMAQARKVLGRELPKFVEHKLKKSTKSWTFHRSSTTSTTKSQPAAAMVLAQ